MRKRSSQWIVLGSVQVGMALLIWGLWMWLEMKYADSGWRAAVIEYIDYQQERGDGSWEIQYWMNARQPEAFGDENGCTSWSGSVFYVTNRRYDHDDPEGLRPLIFPPDQVECVLIEQRYGDNVLGEQRVLFVALHQDLHSAEWIVHEGVSEAADVLYLLDTVSCHWPPGRWPQSASVSWRRVWPPRTK